MSEDLSSTAKIAIQVDQSQLNTLISALGTLSEQGGATSAEADALTRSLLKSGQGFEQVSQTATRATTNLSGVRYALYDVATSAAIAGAALLAPAAAAEATSIKYEKLFSDVARTSTTLSSNPNVRSAQLDTLKQQLIELTTQIPVTFEEVTKIATLGNQLGIPAADLTSFTEQVAKFSATTNVSIDASATAFGRLGQLLGTTDYKKIGDDIAYLGVKSVATETQIISTAQQIAVAANSVHFTETQVISLSAALASLGTAPEQARGVIQQTFADITKAVNTPGAKLNTLATISHETAQQFATEWKTDAAGAFQKFLSGLGENTGTITQNLNAVGLTSVRTVQSIGALAQNSKLVSQLFKDGGDSANYLDKSYAQIATTVSSKLTVAQNGVLALLNQIGSATTGPVGGALDAFNSTLKVLMGLMSDPVFSTSAAIILGLGALAGIAALGSAALFRTAGAVAAMTAVEGGATGVTGLYATALKILTGQSLTAAGAQTTLAESEDAVAVSGTAATLSQEATGVASAGLGAKLSATATSALGLVEAMGPLGVAGVVGAVAIGIGVGIEALIKYIDTTDGAIQTTDQYTASLLKLESGSESANSALKSLSTSISVQSLTKGATGSNLANGRFGNTSFNNAGTTSYKQVGGLKAEANYATTGDYIPGGSVAQNSSAAEQLRNVTSNLTAYDAALTKLANGGQMSAAKRGLADFTAEAEKQGVSAKDIALLLPQATAAINATGSASKSAAQSAADLAAGGNAGTTALTALINSSFGAANATLAVNNSLEALGGAFIKNGAAAASNGPEVQKVIQDIYAASSSGPEAAAKLESLYLEMLKLGSTKSELSDLAATIKGLNDGVTPKADPSQNLSSLVDGYNQAAAAAAKAAQSAATVTKQVVTLADYASNLSSVMKRAFDIRFGPEQGLDTIASGWNTVKKNAADANQAIKDAHASLATLASDRKIDEYWLKVAKNYGDTLRASQIQADLAKNSTDTAKAQSDLANAQQQASTALDGNSTAAINNRATLLGLVNNYESYISSLAASGASQDVLKAKSAQLKAEFIQQATQMGYNRADVEKYASAFDDMTVAIQRVPRNITVTANANPAIQALNEFLAKAKNASSKGVSIPISYNYDGAGAKAAQDALAKSARGEQIKNQINQLTNDLNNNPGFKSGISNAAVQSYINQIAALTKTLNSGNYYTGGYTGDGGMYDVAGFAHRGEFIFDQAATRNLGVANLAALHTAAQTGGPVSIGGSQRPSGPTDLSMSTIQAIAEAVAQIRFVIPGQAIARATTSHNVRATSRGQ